MRANRVREVWAEGGVAANAWLAIGNALSAETMAAQDFDSVTVDMQHGMIGFDAALAMFQAISAYAPAPFTRPSGNDGAEIMKLLDAGAYGVICPLVSSGAACEAFVAACRYPPAGERSFSPGRGQLYGGPDYAERANETIVRLAMIETREGLDSLDGIAAVEGLDGLFIGPNDLSFALGHPPSSDPTVAEVNEAIAEILAAAKRHGIHAGIFCADGKVARRRAEQGFDFVTPGIDTLILATAAAREIATIRGE